MAIVVLGIVVTAFLLFKALSGPAVRPPLPGIPPPGDGGGETFDPAAYQEPKVDEPAPDDTGEARRPDGAMAAFDRILHGPGLCSPR